MYFLKKTLILVFLVLLMVLPDLEVQAQKSSVSNTLLGKVICGYQGWFNCYGDGSTVNMWRHWAGGGLHSEDKLPQPGYLTFEAYPEVSEYQKESLFTTGFDALGNGEKAQLFSSHKPGVIDLHFSWMKQYGIDGVALQRFLGETKNARYKVQRDSITLQIMHSAAKYGRIFYLMYDMSAHDTSFFQNDVLHIEKDLGIFSSENYVHQDGKPVICLWGFGFTHRPKEPQKSLALINWLKAKGYYVIGGVPTNWLTGTVDSYDNYIEVYRAFDMISPWSVGRFKTNKEVSEFKTKHLQPDMEYCKVHHIVYQPVVFPGFAWSNWNRGTVNQISRNKGDFLWQQVYNIKSLGLTNLYVAMFDEYDEGTAIAKIADSYFAVPTNQYFLTSSADGTYVSSDFYLRLVGKATKTMRDELPLTKTHEVSLESAPIWFRTSFEGGYDAMPVGLLSTGTNKEYTVVCKVSGQKAATGKSSLQVSVLPNDLPSGSRKSVVLFDVDIPVSDSTLLNYKVYPEGSNHPCAFVELVASDGSHFIGSVTTDKIKQNGWNSFQFNIGSWGKGKTVCKIVVGYQKFKHSPPQTMYIDDISILEQK
ncbi:MAG TPA: xylosidase [Prolixibacteraceae bacterium]|jgi:hypothetical protein|nr:xylosidase [Prolixibacteraceae bacterium]